MCFRPCMCTLLMKRANELIKTNTVQHKLLTNQLSSLRLNLLSSIQPINHYCSLITVVDLFSRDQYEETANNQQNVKERTALFKADLSFYLLKELSNLTLYLSQLLSLLKSQLSNLLFPLITIKRRKKLCQECI